MHIRPTHKELTRKLRQAREKLNSPSSGYLAAEPSKLAGNFMSLGLYLEEDQIAALRAAFGEVTAKNYTGRKPPDRAFECAVKDEEIFTFVWQSAYFGKKMYLKFCFHESKKYEQEALYIFSLHEDQPHRKVRKGK